MEGGGPAATGSRSWRSRGGRGEAKTGKERARRARCEEGENKGRGKEKEEGEKHKNVFNVLLFSIAPNVVLSSGRGGREKKVGGG